MQVVSLAPVPVASLKWRMGEGAWTLTVVCKLTLQLEQGDAEIAKRHDPIYEQDKFPDDDGAASLFAPSDLVPSRKLVDVMVVGNAYAPRGTTAMSLRPRLNVLSIDKSLHVDAVGEQPFKSAPLGYEYAEAGPTNPVGTKGNDGGHAHRILQAPDPSITNPGFTSPGFGPIAAHWLSRHSLLRGHQEPDLSEPGPSEIPGDFDLGFFNAAPPDQQLHELRPNTELVLEHLHPEHAVLRTRLPNVAPQIFVERQGERLRDEVESRVTALWIDSRRSIATLTFQGEIRLESLDEKGRVWIAVAGPGRRLTKTQLDKLIGSLSRSQDGTPMSIAEDGDDDEEEPDHLNQTVSIRKARVRRPRPGPEDTLTSVLSHGTLGTDPRSTTADDLPATGGDGLPSWVSKQPGPGSSEQPASQPPPRQRATTAPGLGSPNGAGPASGGAPPSEAIGPRPHMLTQHGLGPPAEIRPEWPASHRTRQDGKLLADTSSLPKAQDNPPPTNPQGPVLPIRGSAARATTAQPAVQRGASPGPPASMQQPGSPPPPGVQAGSPGGPAQAPQPPSGQNGGAQPRTAASTVQPAPPTRSGGSVGPPPLPPQPSLKPAATRAPSAMPAPTARPAEPKAEPKPKRRSVPNEVVELLWYDEDATERLRRRWRRLCEELAFAPRDDQHDLPTKDPEAARTHHTHFGVLTEAPLDSAEGLRRTLRDAMSERGRFTPPLVLVAGTLRFPFDEVAVLRATHAVVKPLAADDKKLKATLTQVEELLASPMLTGSTETVSNFNKVLRKSYQSARRSISLEYLDDTVERLLLEQRHYQKRTLFGGEQIRALLTVRGTDKAVPTYLPEALAKKLPMLSTMSVRLIAETHVKQDQYEKHPHGLRVVTLGRVIKVEA